MTPHDVVVGLVAGGVALAFGLIPGLFTSLTDGVQNLGGLLVLGAPAPLHRRSETNGNQRQLGLAVVGVVIVVFTLLAYALS